MNPSCLEKENIEGKKYCCDRSTNNNGRSRRETEILGQIEQKWKRVNKARQKGTKEMRIKMYQTKGQQSRSVRD